METFFQNYDEETEKWLLQDIRDWPKEEHESPQIDSPGFLFCICILAIYFGLKKVIQLAILYNIIIYCFRLLRSFTIKSGRDEN